MTVCWGRWVAWSWVLDGEGGQLAQVKASLTPQWPLCGVAESFQAQFWGGEGQSAAWKLGVWGTQAPHSWGLLARPTASLSKSKLELSVA